MTLYADTLLEVCARTWPAAREFDVGHWRVREGQGGGKRVSAATAIGPVTSEDLRTAEDAMRNIGQRPLYMIRAQDAALDALLAEAGYEKIDPVIVYDLPIANLTDVPIPPVTAFCIWEPLAIMREIWADGGIGPARIAVMERAQTKTAILARWREKPAGTAFAAIHNGVCMVHAVEVLPHQRRMGVAGWIMRAAAMWAEAQGATRISVLCVKENTAANALYRRLGFAPTARYHYRHLVNDKETRNGF